MKRSAALGGGAVTKRVGQINNGAGYIHYRRADASEQLDFLRSNCTASSQYIQPGFKRGHTSAEAARVIAGHARIVRRHALDLLQKRFPDGLTADEVAAELISRC